MEISQIILKIDLNDNKREDAYSVKQALKVFSDLCSAESEYVTEKDLSFNKFKLFFMKKTLFKLLSNYESLNGDLITLTAVRDYEGCIVNIFTAKNSFLNVKPIHEILKIDEQDLKVLEGAEHYGYDNENNKLFAPDTMEYDKEVDPNYISLGYKYQPTKQNSYEQVFAY